MLVVADPTAPFLDLDQVKAQLNIDPASTTEDAELLPLIDAVQGAVEDHTGKLLGSRTVTETLMPLDLTRHLRLSKTPVTAVASITDSLGTAYDVTGAVTRDSGLVLLPYPVRGSLTVTYTAGLASVPAKYTSAGLIIVQHLWETQRGNMPINVAGLADSLGMDTRLGIAAGYAIPNKALELLGARAPVVF